ncbi:unnamed protein product [Nesidiocoris tenuis]|uniref:Uncharacterized protein n=1 Tax=Nesidiocoris tenuis TaxID=355587 RepID=A0A6H5HPI9_9HEMI|nr:unnamed protein product [Nesidiocoris tenuis]
MVLSPWKRSGIAETRKTNEYQSKPIHFRPTLIGNCRHVFSLPPFPKNRPPNPSIERLSKLGGTFFGNWMLVMQHSATAFYRPPPTSHRPPRPLQAQPYTNRLLDGASSGKSCSFHARRSPATLCPPPGPVRAGPPPPTPLPRCRSLSAALPAESSVEVY